MAKDAEVASISPVNSGTKSFVLRPLPSSLDRCFPLAGGFRRRRHPHGIRRSHSGASRALQAVPHVDTTQLLGGFLEMNISAPSNANFKIHIRDETASHNISSLEMANKMLLAKLP